ncbi:MAG: helix-turn-helix domain-containing protein, partial [Pseudomonadota bacterium]
GSAAPDQQPIPNTLADAPEGQLRPLYTEHFADPSGAITPDEVAEQAFLREPCTGRFDIQGPHGALWFRFALENPHDGQANWLLAFMETIFDEMALYEKTDAGLVLRAQNGRMVPLGARSDVSVKTALPVTLAPGQSGEFYLRISGTFAKRALPVLVSDGMFDRWMAAFRTVLLVLLGLMALLITLSLIVFRNVVAQFYKYYTLYLCSAFLFIFITYGFLHRIFDLQIPVTLSIPAIELVTGMSVIANIQYCRVMLSSGPRLRGEGLGFAVLTAVAVFFCAIAVIAPWQFAMPNHLMLFVSPIVLLVFALRRVRSLSHVPAVCASLLCLIGGLAISNYYFLSPPTVPETSSVREVMFTRFGTFSYAFAIIGEAIFMMLAISIMLGAMRARSQLAFEEVEHLRRSLTTMQEDAAEAEKARHVGPGFAEDGAQHDLRGQLRPVEDRFEDEARKIVFDNVAAPEFGSKALAAALGMSERTLGRRMNEVLNTTPAAFIRQSRLTLARDLLRLRHHNTVAEVAYATGFASVSHFAKLYRGEFGETPSQTLRSTKESKAS